MKKLAKIVWIILGIVVLFAIIIVMLAKSNDAPQKETKIDYADKSWIEMTYEERNDFLLKSIDNKSFNNSTEAEHVMREKIKNEIINPKTLKFEWSPSVYNGSANVVEADSGWIYVQFKCFAENNFGVQKEIMGSVTYKYIPETNSLGIQRWDINQNN